MKMCGLFAFCPPRAPALRDAAPPWSRSNQAGSGRRARRLPRRLARWSARQSLERRPPSHALPALGRKSVLEQPADGAPPAPPGPRTGTRADHELGCGQLGIAVDASSCGSSAWSTTGAKLVVNVIAAGNLFPAMTRSWTGSAARRDGVRIQQTLRVLESVECDATSCLLKRRVVRGQERDLVRQNFEDSGCKRTIDFGWRC
jgi:hypothetical protein